MPFESEVIERAKPSGEPDVPLRLATPEDLVILKAIASRPKDLEDIRNIAVTYPEMDRKRIERGFGRTVSCSKRRICGAAHGRC